MKPADQKFMEKLIANRSDIEKAEVIIGHHKKGEAAFWGREILERISETKQSETVVTLHIDYDGSENSQQLEMLCAMVSAVKGKHEYQPGIRIANDGQNWHGKTTR